MKIILKKIITKLGFFELFKIIPELKKQIFKLILFSLIISILDLLSLSLNILLNYIINRKKSRFFLTAKKIF